MIEAIKISDIARKDGVHRGVAYQRSTRGKYATVILPIKPSHRYQLSELKLWLYDVDILKKSGSGFEKSEQTTLIAFDTKEGADIVLRYWNREYFYKLPKNHIFMKK